MHNIYYLGLSGERSLPFGLLVLISVCKTENEKIYMKAQTPRKVNTSLAVDINCTFQD